MSQIPAPDADGVEDRSAPNVASSRRHRSVRRRPPTSLTRLLATHNPLYAVSAALVFYGLRASFPTVAAPGYSVILMACLAAYVLLLVATALFLRRFGTLWEDVRMLVLLVVLLLPAVSVTFDDVLVAHPDVGRVLYLVGGLFAAVICELLILGLRVRFPLAYRLPFHLLLALFFVFPPLVASYADAPTSMKLQWTMYCFAPAVAAILLMLMPAILRGPALVAGNGTPWSWPLYPLSIFVVLGVCACGRTYYLCRSFHFVGDAESIFGSYFLVPIVMAVAVLALVDGVRRRSAAVMSAASALPVLAISLATIDPRRDKIYLEFLDEFARVTGTLPSGAALYLAVGFYAAALALRVPGSFTSLNAVTLLLAVVGPESTSLFDWKTPALWPISAAGLMLLIRGVRRRSLQDCLAATACGVAGVLVGGLRDPDAPTFFLAFHAGLASLMVLGATFPGGAARHLRMFAALALLVACLHSLEPQRRALFTEVPPLVAQWYGAFAVLTAAGYGLLVPDRWMLAAAAIMSAGWIGAQGWRTYRLWRMHVAGLDQIALGLLAFVAAVGVSVAKAIRLRPAELRVRSIPERDASRDD